MRVLTMGKRSNVPGDYNGYRSIRYQSKVIFSCLTAIPFIVFAFVYFRIGTLHTALSGALIVLALILVLEGFMILRKMADHIEQLSITMSRAEEGEVVRVREDGETKELAVIADTFNRTLSKLEETARELGVRAVQASTLNEIRELVSKNIHMEEVAKIILERAMKAVLSPGGYLAVKREDSPVLNIAATSGITENMPDTMELDAATATGSAIFNSKGPLLIEDASMEPYATDPNIPAIGFPRLLYIPIVAKGTSIGVLVLGRDQSQPHFKGEDAQFLQTLLQQVAYSVENARLYESLNQSNRELKIALDYQKKTQDHLVASARMAAFGELSINIAHELNNPLTGIMGYTDLLLGPSLSETEKIEYLEEIRSQTMRASHITKSLLDLISSKPGSKIQTDLNGLVEKILSLIKGRIQDHNVHLDIRLTDNLPPLLVDPAQMGQVFFNLLNNALNAMTGVYGGLSITDEKEFQRSHHIIRIETGKKNNKIYVSFRDTGQGIAPEDLPRIFEPFFSTQKKVSQVGLGLWVAQRIVKAHGGFIRVKSDPGAGSNFIVVLPLNIWKLGNSSPGQNI